MKVCKKCNSVNVRKYGTVRNGGIELKQKMKCIDCNHVWNLPILRFRKNVSENKRMIQRYLDKGILNIGYVDIETDGQLQADFGNVITAVILIRNVQTGKTKMFKWRVSKKEIVYDYDSDKRIITNLFEKIKECDLVIGHYFNGWKKFDMPFLRARAEQLKIKIPTYGTLKYGDTWNMAHSVLKIQGYSLGAVARGLGLKNIKTSFDSWAWRTSRQGMLKDWKKAILQIEDHNVKDVILTYRIHKKLEKYVAISSNSF